MPCYRHMNLWASLIVSVTLMSVAAAPPVVGRRAPAAPARPAAPAAPTFTVNNPFDAPANLADTDYTVCRTEATNTVCTLRAAIMKANRFAGGGASIIIPSGAYTLTVIPGPADDRAGDLNITQTVTIAGAGAANTVIDGGAIDRVFDVSLGVNVTISGLTIRNGQAVGGGGIRSSGSLTLTNSSVSGNSSTGTGGGIYSLDGTLTLNKVLISNNIANFGGGVLGANETISIDNSVISENRAGDGGGLDVFNSTTTLNHSALTGNVADSAGSYGGGFWLEGGSLRVDNSTINANRSSYGAGIYIWSSGDLTLNNSTITANSAFKLGGGISNYDGTARLFHSTVAGNLADSGSVGFPAGGGIATTLSSTVELYNTLLAENYSGAALNDCTFLSNTLTSRDYNYLQTGAGCLQGTTTHNVYGGDVLLGPLQDNGGATSTRTLFTGSPALDQIPPAQCRDSTGAFPVPDQRGVARPIGPLCDIGAYEGVQPLFAYNRNLIRNGDAESGGSSSTGAYVGTPNWLVTGGSFTAVPYNAPGGFPSVPTDTVPANHGYNFFAGGANPISIASQVITVTAASAAIDAGGIQYTLSGDLGGYLDQEDNATLTATFLDQTSSPIGSPVTIGPVTPADRCVLMVCNLTGFQHRSATGIVPPGTRTIRVVVTMTAVSGPYNDGYADNLSLVLTSPTLFLPLVLR